MKFTLFTSALALTAAAALPAAENNPSPKIHVNIVGEIYAPNYSQPSPTAPAYYVFHDAGFMQKGDPVSNDNPPPATSITQALTRYLPSANFLPATAAHAPSLLLISQWGSLRDDSYEITPFYEITKSLRARIRLVSTPDLAQRIERELTDRIYTRSMRSMIPSSSMLSNLERNTLDIASDDHYFVIVTAYDYAAALQKQIVPVWRLKLSTYDRGVSMPDALPALIRNGRNYFGQSTAEPINEKMALRPLAEVKLGDLKFLDEAPPAPAEISAEVLQTIKQAESAHATGVKAAPAEKTKAAIPTALNDRLEAHRAKKLALQNELKAQLASAAPGSDQAKLITAFNHQQADRIDALKRELEAIRSELAQLAAAQPGQGKSLQALVDEFATANY